MKEKLKISHASRGAGNDFIPPPKELLIGKEKGRQMFI
jgi:hypothetical protein